MKGMLRTVVVAAITTTILAAIPAQASAKNCWPTEFTTKAKTKAKARSHWSYKVGNALGEVGAAACS